MNKLHVLIIPSWYPRPDAELNGIFFKEQAEALSQHGVKIGIISPDLCSPIHHLKKTIQRIKSPPIVHYLDNNIETYEYNGVSWFPKLPYANYFLWRRAGLLLYKRYVAQHGKPDIIHAHCSLYGGLIALSIKKKYRVPYIITEHSSDYLRDLLPNWKIKLVKRAIESSNKLIAVSSSLHSALEKKYGNTPGAEIIPNMISNNVFYDTLPLKDNPSFIFLCIGRLEENKNQLMLVKSFSEIFQKNSSIRLKLIGDGPLKTEIEEYTKTHGIQEAVELLGVQTRDKVIEEIKRADVVVSTSLFETFGMTLIEAISQGTPIIATKSGGPQDIVNDINGILVNPTSSDILTAAMNNMIDNYHTYKSKEISLDAFSRFSSKSICTRLIALYKKILTNG